MNGRQEEVNKKANYSQAETWTVCSLWHLNSNKPWSKYAKNVVIGNQRPLLPVKKKKKRTQEEEEINKIFKCWFSSIPSHPIHHLFSISFLFFICWIRSFFLIFFSNFDLDVVQAFYFMWNFHTFNGENKINRQPASQPAMLYSYNF